MESTDQSYLDTCRAAIGHMLLAPESAVELCDKLEPRHFLDPTHRAARYAIEDILRSAGEVGPHSVSHEMARAGLDWKACNLEIAECMGCSTFFRSRDAVFLIRRHVAEKAMHRDLLEASDQPVTLDLVQRLQERARQTEVEISPQGELADFFSDIESGRELMLSDEQAPASLYGEGLVCAGTLVGLVGPPKVGKTFLLVQLLRAAALGEAFLGFQPDFHPDSLGQGLRVGLLEMEMSRGEVKKRLADITSLDGVFANNLSVKCMPKKPVDLSQPASQRMLEAWITGMRLGVLGIDSASKVSGLSAGRQEKEAADMAAWLVPLAYMARRTGCCIVINFHTRKRQGENRDAKDSQDVVEAIRGSGGVAADLDTIMLMEPTPTKQVRIKTALRQGAELDTIYVERTDTGMFERVATPGEQRNEQHEAVLLILSQVGESGTTAGQVSVNLRCSDATARRLLKAVGAVRVGSTNLARWVHPQVWARMDQAQQGHFSQLPSLQS